MLSFCDNPWVTVLVRALERNTTDQIDVVPCLYRSIYISVSILLSAEKDKKVLSNWFLIWLRDMASLKSIAQSRSLGTQAGLLFVQLWGRILSILGNFSFCFLRNSNYWIRLRSNSRAISKRNFLSLESSYHKWYSYLPKYFTVTSKLCVWQNNDITA